MDGDGMSALGVMMVFGIFTGVVIVSVIVTYVGKSLHDAWLKLKDRIASFFKGEMHLWQKIGERRDDRRAERASRRRRIEIIAEREREEREEQ